MSIHTRNSKYVIYSNQTGEITNRSATHNLDQYDNSSFKSLKDADKVGFQNKENKYEFKHAVFNAESELDVCVLKYLKLSANNAMNRSVCNPEDVKLNQNPTAMQGQT